MGFCRSAVCVLILLMYLHCAVVEAAPDEKTVRVYLNDSALLPCSDISCTETVSWVKLQNSSYVVAQCDRSSCSSTEGYQMSLSDYWNGNFSLNITAVTPSNTGSYSCKCEHTLLQEVLLQITAAPTAKVEFKGTAVLPFTDKCSGVVRWSMLRKPSDILAECDQTSCRSVKEGYQMIYNQYLQGNFSLIITEADFSKRGLYTYNCDGRDLYHVRLQINPLQTQKQIKPGESLLLGLDVLEPVEVMYSKTGAANHTSRPICTVDKRSQVKSPYTLRTSLALELKEVNESDSGFYIIRDTENKEDIHIYNVTVQGEHKSDGDKEDSKPERLFWLMVVLCIVFFLVVVVLSAKIVCMSKNNKSPCEEKLEQCLKPEVNEEASQDTEQGALIPTLDNRDLPSTVNSAGTGQENSEQ